MRRWIALCGSFGMGLIVASTLHGPGATATGGSGAGGGFIPCGDLNADGAVDISDAVTLLAFLFQGGKPPVCPSCCPDRPDLTVADIDVDSISVSCSGGPGTCQTTVTFTVANTGAVAAGPFRIHIAFDPGVDMSIPVSGLSPGATLTQTVTGPVGGSCFDPDCTICVLVDSENQIQECSEDDNLRCATRQG